MGSVFSVLELPWWQGLRGLRERPGAAAWFMNVISSS